MSRESLSRNLYVEGEEPGEDFSIVKALGEILLSYVLIFGDSPSSRDFYRNNERRKTSLPSNPMTFRGDPVLDELCGLNKPNHWFAFNQPVRDSYDASTDFPIFKDRLKKVQRYMQAIQPNRFRSLWQDRRDLRLWYTIWTVIILGGISIIQTTINIIIAALQLQVAQNSYRLQRQQRS